LGITNNCPVILRLEDCPFKDVVRLWFNERECFINDLTKEEKTAVPEYYQACSGFR